MDFLKEFSRQLSGKGRSNPEKAREGAEAARLGEALRAAQASLDSLYGRYGRACYAAQEGRGDPEAVRQLALRIEAARLEVEELTAARDAALAWKRCPGCGMAFPREARFCSACGRKLPEEAPKPEPVAEGEYCPACGAALEGGEASCPVCGALIGGPASPSAHDAQSTPGSQSTPGTAVASPPEPEEPDDTME